jgi:NAD dependent epimerase/dehydratase family enzyme
MKQRTQKIAPKKKKKKGFIFSFSRLASAPSSIAVLFNVQTLPPPVA